MGLGQSKHKPTLGYPNQKAAVIALYQAGHRPADIAKMVGGPINSVQRALSEYRRKQGIPAAKRNPQSECDIEPERPNTIWDMDEDERREEFARRAAKAAREARMAA